MLAGTAYILSSAGHASVRNDAQAGNIESADELASRRSFVNTMAVGSGILAAGAVGIGVTAFIDVNGGGGLGLTARF